MIRNQDAIPDTPPGPPDPSSFRLQGWSHWAPCPPGRGSSSSGSLSDTGRPTQLPRETTYRAKSLPAGLFLSRAERRGRTWGPYQVQGMVHSSYPGAWGYGSTVPVNTESLSSNPCLVGEREMRTETHSNSTQGQRQLLEPNEQNCSQ